jgi:hypothetical protein
MRGVMSEVPESLLAWRRRTGADRFDETWAGVLHMNPSPTPGHQDLEFELERWLRAHGARARRGRVLHNVNVSPRDAGSKAVVRAAHIQGPPEAVVEIRSPNDEAVEKLPFHAALGVPEVCSSIATARRSRSSSYAQGRTSRQGPARTQVPDDPWEEAAS